MLSALLGYASASFAASARTRLSSGMPRPEVDGAYYNARDDRYEPLFGGTTRLPMFFALDVRVEQVLVSDPVRWTLYLDVLNATGHENVEEVAYNYDYTARDDVIGWPTLAVLGTRLEL